MYSVMTLLSSWSELEYFSGLCELLELLSLPLSSCPLINLMEPHPTHMWYSVTVSRFLKFFLCIGSFSVELCSANSNCFSLSKYLHLSPQLSKSAMLRFHSPQWPTWVFQKCKVGLTLEKSINIINHINILKGTHDNLSRQMQKNHSMKFNNYQ